MKRNDTRIDIEMAIRGIKRDGDLAKMLGLTAYNFSARTRNEISMKTLEMIAKGFDMSVKELLK